MDTFADEVRMTSEARGPGLEATPAYDGAVFVALIMILTLVVQALWDPVERLWRGGDGLFLAIGLRPIGGQGRLTRAFLTRVRGRSLDVCGSVALAMGDEVALVIADAPQGAGGCRIMRAQVRRCEGVPGERGWFQLRLRLAKAPRERPRQDQNSPEVMAIS